MYLQKIAKNLEVFYKKHEAVICNGQKSFSFRGAKLWNSLNTEAKLATSLIRFKSLI